MTKKSCPWCHKPLEILFTLEDGMVVCKINQGGNKNW